MPAQVPTESSTKNIGYNLLDTETDQKHHNMMMRTAI